MILSSSSATTSTHKAYDSVWVEFDSIWLKPRLVFDELTRSAFDACAEICNAVLHQRMGAAADEFPPVRCDLRTGGPGTYLLSFEIPDESIPPHPDGDAETAPRHWEKARPALDRHPGALDAALQPELLSATRILEEMMLAVSLICATPAGQLGATLRHRSHGTFVEFVNGVRAMGDLHRDSWDMLVDPAIQALLRRVFTPFQDPELHTMTVREIPPEGSLGSSWVITANGPLRHFANGAALEVPALQGPMRVGQDRTTTEGV